MYRIPGIMDVWISSLNPIFPKCVQRECCVPPRPPLAWGSTGVYSSRGKLGWTDLFLKPGEHGIDRRGYIIILLPLPPIFEEKNCLSFFLLFSQTYVFVLSYTFLTTSFHTLKGLPSLLWLINIMPIELLKSQRPEVK